MSERYDAVALENLNMRAMSQCLQLKECVMDNGYGMFLNMLKYKLEGKGKQLVKIDCFYRSSKICSRSGKIKEKLPLSERIYECACGNRMDWDVNAAVNIPEE